jgi:hypothetical protein
MKQHQIKLLNTKIKHQLVKVNVTTYITNENCFHSFVIVLSPSKKKKKTSNGVISSNGTIESFFKKTNSTSSSTDVNQSVPKKIIDITAEEQSSTINSHDHEIKPNYATCPTCQVLLPKANLFIHQIRCYK